MSDNTRTIPLGRPDISQQEKDAVLNVLDSGWLAHGTYNHKFEELFCQLLGIKHAITVNSCTSALELALWAHQIKGEVLVPSFTFVASANAIVTAGAVPVFVEVNEATRNVSAAHLEQALTPNTEAVMVVHFAGQPCNMLEISAFCDRHSLLLIEDCAETLGAHWAGRVAGSFGIGAFSFFPTKNITSGEGGMFTCNDDALAERARALSAHGIQSSTAARERSPLTPWQRDATYAGRNFRMSNILAAIGYVQLQRLNELNAERQRLAAIYNTLISELDADIRIPQVAPAAEHVYQMYTVQLDVKLRDKVITELRNSGVGASVHFDPAVHQQQFYREHFLARHPLPLTEKLSKSLITLPLYPGMQDDDVVYVVKALEMTLNKLLGS